MAYLLPEQNAHLGFVKMIETRSWPIILTLCLDSA